MATTFIIELIQAIISNDETDVLFILVRDANYYWVDRNSPSDGKDAVALRGARKIFIV